MKRRNVILIILLISSVLITAFPIGALAAADELIISPWAKEEVQRAQELGLVPDLLVDYGVANSEYLKDYTVPITRDQYIMVAMRFTAMQQHYDYDIFCTMAEKHLAEKNADGSMKKAFYDGDGVALLAYYLGLAKGKGSGMFDPDALITRQEAAVILTRAYETCGGTLPENLDGMRTFADEKEIADWAKDSVSALAFWNVMQGMEDGSFYPEGYYTVEQCIVTFIRLYEKAPVSRKNGNVNPLFTYEQGVEYVHNRSDMQHEELRIEGPVATFIRMDLSGMLRAVSTLWFVYPNGGVQSLNSAVQNKQWGLTPNKELEDPHFSEDGKTFYYTVIIEEDVLQYYDDPKGGLLTEKGIYHITIDVDTCKYQIQKEALPE